MKGFLILRMVLLLELLQQGLVFGRFLPSFSFTATARACQSLPFYPLPMENRGCGRCPGHRLPEWSFGHPRKPLSQAKPTKKESLALSADRYWMDMTDVIPLFKPSLVIKKPSTFCFIAWHAYLFGINCILATEASFWEGQELNSKYALSDEKSSNASISKAPYEKRGKYFLFHSMTCLPFWYQLHLSCWGLLLRRARA